MEPLYIYPGTFCPPHYGHVAVAKEAAKLFGKVIVICSVNPVKKDRIIFTPQECKEMWQTYNLGKNIEIVTLDEFLEKWNRSAPTVMVRGIRDNNDIIYENDVMLYNFGKFGLRNYHYILCQKQFEKMSSTAVRAAALGNNIAALGQFVNQEIAARLLERASIILK